jgi:hypothetical protein
MAKSYRIPEVSTTTSDLDGDHTSLLSGALPLMLNYVTAGMGIGRGSADFRGYENKIRLK